MYQNLMTKLKRCYQKGGFWLSVQVIVKKITSKLLKRHTSIWFEKNINDQMKPKDASYEFDICHDFDEIATWIKKMNKDHPWMYNSKEMAIARSKGHLIYYGKFKGEIIGYTKVALNQVYIRDYDELYTLSNDKAMFYDTTVLPSFRGKKVPYFIKFKLFDVLRDKGIKKIYAHIEPWNIASIKSNQKVGFNEILENRYTLFMGFRHHAHDLRKILG